MKRNTFTISIILMLSCFFFVACGRQDDKATQPEPPVAMNPVTINGDTMIVSLDGNKAVVTKQSTGYVASYGDFHVMYKNPEYLNGQIVAVGFREWTADDELDIRVEALGYRHQRETYTRNGKQLVLDIVDNLSEEQQQQLVDFLNDGPSNSVMNNADGYVLNSILEPNWENIDVAISELSPDKRPKWGDILCNAATACVASKCYFGGLANSVCGSCAAVRFACAIMDLFGLWE